MRTRKIPESKYESYLCAKENKGVPFEKKIEIPVMDLKKQLHLTAVAIKITMLIHRREIVNLNLPSVADKIPEGFLK
jgi:hypothetical protein